ncbi:hypothetical protein [Vibrio gangliei]|uniref:hypothetical protein n=1 Tax=Vibrio gangliei TaxID=2077090 RepID=UPI000D016B32|nr:hypothetical protein [Vibrio gangliei]
MISRARHFYSISSQQGAATLLTAVLLLAAALVVSLASYKSVFFQGKRAQNEIEARQLHWKGEGRLECVFAKLVDVSSNDPNSVSYNDCDQPTNIHITRQGTSNLYTVESNENGYRVVKVLRVPTVGTMGALSANADIYFLGSYEFNPQPLEILASGSPKCVSVKYSKSLYLAPDTPKSELVTDKVMTPEMLLTSCDSEYITDVEAVTTLKKLSEINDGLDSDGNSLSDETEFKGDYLYEENFQPFEELFGVPKSELTSIKDEFEVINGGQCALYGNGTTDRNPSNCACDANIAQKILQDKKLVWVDGNCDIGLGSKIQSADAFKGSTGTIVVIQNGIFSSTGSVPFNGVLYQLYTNNLSPSLSVWDGYTGKVWANSTFSDIGQVPIAYLSGSYEPKGLVVIDAPDQIATFHGGFKFTYDKSKIENPLGQLLKPKWIKGSWNDF